MRDRAHQHLRHLAVCLGGYQPRKSFNQSVNQLIENYEVVGNTLN